MQLPSDPVMDEMRASEEITELCMSYGIITSAPLMRVLFRQNWRKLSRLAHALHHAQERRNEQEQTHIYSNDYEGQSG
jgi:hypothetical protein